MGDDLFDKLKEEGPISNKVADEKEFCFKETPIKTYIHHISSPVIHKEHSPIVNLLGTSSPVDIIAAPNDSPVKGDTISTGSRSNSLEKNLSPRENENNVDVDDGNNDAGSNKKNNLIKPLKVLVKRTPMKDHVTPSPLKKPIKRLMKGPKKICNRTNDPVNDQPVKMTLTKAQQKSFEPIVSTPKKMCVVKIQRVDFKQLQQQLNSDSRGKTVPLKNGTQTPLRNNTKLSKRQSTPAKKRSMTITNEVKSNSELKSTSANKSNFLVKLSPPLKAIKIKKRKYQFSTQHNYDYQQLIKTYGKRWFNVCVRMPRCKHPLLLTFESNARARMMQAKKSKSKSKNLRVTFLEEVEVFGDVSDTDEDVLNDESSVCTLKTSDDSNTDKCNAHIIMPARLKKVENGKFIDDIEFDPTLFVDPNDLRTSTPMRKKTKHKSVSPLKKDDGTPSPRKEKLKLSNEIWMKRKNLDDEDEEDDDCEYIVPNDLPPRRSSRTGSNTTVDVVMSNSAEFPAETTYNSESAALPTETVNRENESTNVTPENLDKSDNETSPLDKIVNQISPLATNNSKISPLHKMDNEVSPLDKIDNEVSPLDKGDNKIAPLDKGDNKRAPLDKGDKEMSPLDEGDKEMSPLDEGDNEIGPLDKGDDEMPPLDEGDNEMLPLDKDESEIDNANSITEETDAAEIEEANQESKEQEETLAGKTSLHSNSNSNNSFESAIEDTTVNVKITEIVSSDASINYLPALTDLQSPMDLFDDVLNGTEVLQQQQKDEEIAAKIIEVDDESNCGSDISNKILKLTTSLDDIPMRLFSDDLPVGNDRTNAMEDSLINDLTLGMVDATEKPFTAID